ncbi:MAG: radical SAM protein [bacterium]
MKKFDFYISYLCASKCAFCCVLDKINWFRDNKVPPHIPFQQVKDVLDEKHADGYGHVTLTGGEPTLHPRFAEILAYAKKLRMRTSVNSNMMMFADERFCRAAMPYVDEIVASVHGHTAELHNSITGTKDGFERFVKGMENVVRMKPDLYLITDTVLVTPNIVDISGIVDFLLSIKGLRHILFSNVNLPPDKLDGREYLVPTLPQIEEILPEIVERIAFKSDKILRFYGIPFCALKDYHAYSSDLYFEPKMVWERVRREDDMVDREYAAPKPNMAKKKTKKCAGCLYEKTCGGFFNSYYTLFGDKHIKPILKK